MQGQNETEKTKVRRPAKAPKAPKEPGNGKKNTTAKQVGKNLLKALLVLVCIGAVVLGVLAVFVTRYLVDATANDDLILNLETMSVPQTSYILARDEGGGWVEYQKLDDLSKSVWAPLDEMPAAMKDAVISTEDRNFEKHGGVNWGRTVLAALNEVFHFRDTFGASTINQQLVKNLTGEKEVVGEDGGMLDGYKRKAREIYRAIGLDKAYSKDMILEAYLNTMPLSGTIVGVQAAAQEYFGKDAAALSLPECAAIAGITQNPGKYNPYTNPEACVQRRNDVLDFMLENETITAAACEEAKAAPLSLYSGPTQADTTAETSGVTSYFSDAVLEAVVADLVENGVVPTREAALKLYYTGGLQIEATVDMGLQKIMEEVYEQGYAEDGLFPAEVSVEAEVDGKTQTVRPQSAMAVVSHGGALVGVVGGIGEKTESLGLNRATQSPRSIGSTMKPLTAYALGIDYGIIDYSRLVSDSYVSNQAGDPAGAADWPRNYDGAPGNGAVPVCDAVAKSLNTVPVRVGSWVGLEPMYEFLSETLHITTLVGEGSVNDMGYSSLVLGGMTQGVTAAQLAAAYTIFGGAESYGVYNTLHCYERVLDSRGNVLLEQDITSVQAISAEAGYVMNRLLAGVLRPGGTAAGITLETSDAVAKTGTTSDDKDRWFVGVTPNYVGAVWWGYDDNYEIEWPASAQTNPPPNVWREVMDRAQAGAETTEFAAPPEGVVEARFCRASGMLAGGGCANTQVGYYTGDNVPEGCDSC